MSELSLHLFDVNRPDDEPFPVTVYSDAVPRVGDRFLYWVDFPLHNPEQVRAEPGEPCRVSGVVHSVLFEFRATRGWGLREKTVPMVSIYLSDYQAEPFPPAAVEGANEDPREG